MAERLLRKLPRRMMLDDHLAEHVGSIRPEFLSYFSKPKPQTHTRMVIAMNSDSSYQILEMLNEGG